MIHRTMKIPIYFLIIQLLVLPGCSYFGNRPLATLKYQETVLPDQKNLFIFLRALGGGHRIFESKGMVANVHERDIPFHMMAPSASYAYYSERTIVERLHKDVILPAVEEGYTNIWLVGVSMGGLGALLYLREKPEFIHGIYLIFPFLGDDEIIDEIHNGGGLKMWEPGDYNPEKEWMRPFWHWIKREKIGEEGIPVVLGYGSDDWYVSSHDLLAENLPEERVIRIEGSHNFPTMKKLWNIFLDRELYESSATPKRFTDNDQ